MRLSIVIKILLIIQLFDAFTEAIKICHQCQGINCQRTSYNKTQECVDEMDICVTIFEGQTLQAQGCLQQLPLELRGKCADKIKKDDEDHQESLESTEINSECYKCLSSYCNNVGPAGFECLQCDSKQDIKCRSDPSALPISKCPVSRTSNIFCFVSDNGNRTTRGCVASVKEQKDCLKKEDCLLCSPLDLEHCNVVQIKDHNNGGNEGGNGGNDNGGNDGGNEGNDNGGNDGGNGGNDNGGNDGGNGGNDNGGNDGGNGGGDNDGGNGHGNNGNSLFDTFSLNFLIATLCFFTTNIMLI